MLDRRDFAPSPPGTPPTAAPPSNEKFNPFERD